MALTSLFGFTMLAVASNVSWMYAGRAVNGEMFRPNVRSLGSAMTLICGCSVGLLSTSTFNFLAVTFGNYTPFWIFAAVNLFGFFFTLLVVPETKGKSLMEIEIMMRSGKHEPSL
ncbi:hypothetical protein MSG28_014117 [Choristoneura fumiferana]|uniref:Uncharacterized protein n=1 Tax=Choristoneura fumiferana TaxID=7141 RepID=A0ACC0JG27_CHOFU|nr:hypothetical protein MSG28_014117 [Choristoneura fumiferana]